MSDVANILLGALGGVLLYVVGQLLSKFLIDPLHELRKAVGEVRFNLSFHAVTIGTPIGRTEETSEAAHQALMKSSSDLIAKLHAVPLYGLTRYLAFGALTPRSSVEAAAIQLRGLSTHVHETGEKAMDSLEAIQARIEKIERLLRLKPLE